VIDPTSQIRGIRYKVDVNTHNIHVLLSLTVRTVVVAVFTAPLAVSCDGCTPVDGPDAGPGADAGPVPAPTILALNEVMSRNGDTVSDDFDEFDDWLELYNLTDEAVDLAGFTLEDSGGEAVAFATGAVVPANGFLVVFLDDALEQGSAAEPHFPFKLAGEGDTLLLRDEDTVVDAFTIPALEQDESFGRNPDGEGDPVKLGAATPGASNASTGEGEGEGEGEGNCNPTILINEVLAENVAAHADAAGDFDAWVELYNAGAATGDLGGLQLVVGASSATLPAHALASDEYIVVFLDNEVTEGSAATEPHVNVTIDAATSSLTLRDECGDEVNTMNLSLGGPDVSVGIAPGGAPDDAPVALTPTPNAPNEL
jgi:hypothetical protein